MATTPEHLVDYTASPEEPNLDAMRYMLMQRSATPATPAVDLPSQIPGVQPAPQQQQRPLDRVTEQFKRIGANANPLLMAKSLQDMVTTAVVNPLLMPASIAGEALTGRPITGSLLAKQPQTPLGQDFAESLFKGLETAKVPHMWPLTPRPAGMRPALTPNDVRVMGAKATHAVREAGQIPTDIANVRGAGIQRLSPLTGQPSVGSRIGSAIEGTAQTAGRVGDVARDVGQSTADYMQMRRDMGLSPVPGVPPEFFPDLNLYAMRPKDSTLVTPSVPPTKDVTALDIGTAPQTAIHDIGAHRPELRPSDALAYLAGMDLDVPRTDEQGFAPITSTRADAFRAFVEAKAQELYPDAPNAREAVLAMDDRFSRQADRDDSRIKLYDQFRESPEGKAVGMDDLPSSKELQERHAAASQWLNSTLINYVRRKFGAEGDPLVQQASQGFTMLPAEDVRRMAENVNEDVLKRWRSQLGMPVAGTLAPAIRDKSVELADATAAVEQLEQRREEYRNVAMQQGLPDPAQLPEYAATTNPLNAAVNKRDKLQEELNNLQLGRDYEKLSDIAISADTQRGLLGKIEYPQQQFYPSVTRARPDEMLFHISRAGPLQHTGFNELAAQFYDDVIRGNIPVDKLKGLTVEKYVRNKVEGRVAEEKRQAQATAELKNSIESRMQQDMQRYVKPENYFGNVGVLELSTSTGFTPEQIRQLISDDTLVLDHCVAEGPTPGSKAKNLWNGKERRYMPLVDPITGQLSPGAPRQYTRYMREAGDPDPSRASMLASVRDKNTGLPVATIEFQHASNGKYRIGYASGYQNGNVKNEYHEAIKEYLNSRADMIEGSGDNLSHVGLLDLHSTEATGELQRILGVPRRDAGALLDAELANGTLPRFGTRDDLRQIFTVPQTAPVVQQPATTQPAAQQGMTATNLYEYLQRVGRTIGVDESAAVSRVLHQARQSFDGTPAYSELLRAQPTALAERIADLASEQGNAIVEQALLDLADRIAPRVPPAQPLNPPEAWPLVGQQLAEQQPAVQSQAAGAPLVPSTRLAIDDAFELAERGLQGDPSAIELLNDLENDIRGTYLQPNATITDLRSMRIRLESTYDRFSDSNRPQFQAAANALYNDLLPAINAILAPPAVPVNAPVNARIGERQPLTFDARSFAQGLLEDARLDNQTFNVDDLSAALFTLENGNFDDARFRALGENNAVSQRAVAGHLRQLMGDAGIPLPFAQQPAAPQRPALGVFEEFAIARDLLEDARLDNQTFNTGDLSTTLFALENGNFDDPRFRALGPNSAAAQREVANALRQTMQDAGIPLPFAQQPTPQAQALIDNVRAADLADIVNFIDPNRWPLLDARVDQAAQGVYPADAATIAEAIRNGQMPDITNGLDVVERELVARNAQQLVEVNARRQNAAAQQPVMNTQAYIAQVRDTRGDVVADRVAQEVRAAQTAAVTAADVPIILRNAAERNLDPVVEDALLDLATQFETQLREAQPANQFDRAAFDATLAEHFRALREEFENADTPEGLGDWEPDPTHPANWPAQPPQAQGASNIAPFSRIPGGIRGLPDTNLLASLSQEQFDTSTALSQQLINQNDADELRMLITMLRNHAIGLWSDFSPEQREHTARLLEQQIGDRPQGYKSGGIIRKSAPSHSFALKYANGGTVPQTQSLDAMKYELMMRSK